MLWMDVDAALTAVPVNIAPLIDDTDFKTIEDAVAYNAAGMDLRWNFVTTAGVYTSTAVTPTTGGSYDWTHQGDGMYSIEIPASGGASINNDTEGFGWFSGKATGVLPWRGPIIGFRAAGTNNALIDLAWSTTRGLAGTALPDAAADAAGGLPISDAGGLDLDAIGTKIGYLPSATAGAAGGLFIAGSNAATTVASFTCSGAFTVNSFTCTNAFLVSGTTTHTGNVQYSGAFTVIGAFQAASINSVSTTSLNTVSMSSLTVGGATTLTGAVTATHASNNITGVTASALANNVITAAAIADNAIDEATFAADTAKYQAKVWMVDDDAAGTPTDRYAVIWFKNGQPVVSGITDTDLWVFDHAGSDLIGTAGSPGTMTEIGSSGTYYYGATSTARLADGSLYLARVRATINGATRIWYQQVGRDS